MAMWWFAPMLVRCDFMKHRLFIWRGRGLASYSQGDHWGGNLFCSLKQIAYRHWKAWIVCAVSSVVEHYLDTVGVAGSNPAPRTIPPLDEFSSGRDTPHQFHHLACDIPARCR